MTAPLDPKEKEARRKARLAKNLKKLKDKYVGKKVHRFIIDDITYDDNLKRYQFLATCECGKKKKIRRSHLLAKTNPTRSCGCYLQEKLQKIRKGNVWNVKPEGEAAFNKVLRNYMNGAKARSLDFDLTKNEFREIIFSNCVYCGSSPKKETSTKGGSIIHNGVDRLKNNEGYTKENSAPCCTRCNFFKGSMDSSDFLELATNIGRNNRLKDGLKESKLDHYYSRTFTVAQQSPDENTKVGAILINPETGAVVSSGYNGFVRNANDSQLPTSGVEKYDYMIHAELNLICNAASHGIRTSGHVLFSTLSPCVSCMRSLYQAGITTIYYRDTYRDFAKNLNMKDLIITLTNLGDYTRIDLRGSKK